MVEWGKEYRVNSGKGADMSQNLHRTAKSLQYTIETAAAGMTLEQYLKQNLHFTKAQIRSMKFRENGLRINGERVRVSRVLQAGESLKIRWEAEETASNHLEAAPGDLEILYEDNDLIAVWKEAGLVLHPSHGHYQDTLSNRLHGYFRDKNEQVMIRSIGRLDRDTAGIVVFAKNQVAAARLWQQKEAGVFEKEYLALCSGEFTEEIHTEQTQNLWHTIDAPIGPMPGELMKMCVTPEGKHAVTHYQVIKKRGAHTLIRARIETGRTHQIRVHLSSLGHRIMGDEVYGVPNTPFEKKNAKLFQGQLLHAKELVLRHPTSGEQMHFECELPPEFEEILEKLRAERDR